MAKTTFNMKSLFGMIVPESRDHNDRAEAAGKCRRWGRLKRAHISNHKHKTDSKLKTGQGREQTGNRARQSQSLVTYFLQQGYTSIPPHTAPPPGDQIFKCPRLEVTALTQITTPAKPHSHLLAKIFTGCFTTILGLPEERSPLGLRIPYHTELDLDSSLTIQN